MSRCANSYAARRATRLRNKGATPLERSHPPKCPSPAAPERLTDMSWHPEQLMRGIFAVLVCLLVVVSVSTEARPQTARQWARVWLLFVFLAWALLGVGWLRSR